MSLDDQSLLQGLKKGNELAYQQLFHDYYPLLISYAAKFLSSKDGCREVIQEVFIRLYDKRNDLEIQSLKGYLLKAVYHGCISEYRSQSKFYESHETDLVEDEDHLEQAENEARIWKAIDELPERCHEIFILSRFEGLKNQEIANKLGITKRTVETQISLALKNLKDKLLNIIWLLPL